MRALLALALAIPAAVAVAQRPPARDAADVPVRIIRGQVRSDDDGAALLRKVKVTVAGRGAAFTDQEGWFEITVAQSTTAPLRLSKPGFAPVHVPMRAVDPVDPLQVRLPRGAAIVGRVFDELGLPAMGADVRVRRLLTRDDRDGVPINVSIQTDDLGEFRVGSLPAGTYETYVEPEPGSEIAAPEKTSLRLRAGEEADVALFYEAAAYDVRRAAADVSKQQAEQQETLTPLARFQALGTGYVTGRVTAPDGRGVPGAIVRLKPAAAGRAHITASSAQGFFQFAGVHAGTYRVVATKSGFVTGEYGQERAGEPGRLVTIRDRQRTDRIDVGLRRGAVVTGTVTDADGEPLEGLTMHVWRLRFWSGRQITEAVTDVAVRKTDDRGNYRLHGLQPGTYYVVASDDVRETPSTQPTAAPRSYHPGVPTIGEASPIHVDVGVDATATHVTFTSARTVRVAGRAYDSTGTPLQVPVVLAGSTRSGVTIAPQIAMMSGTSFTFEHVPPGEYVLYAIQRIETPEHLLLEFERRQITVAEADVSGLLMITSKGTTVNGRMVVEGDRAPGSRPPFPIDVISADPDFAPPPGQFRPWTVRVFPDWTFQVDGLSGPVRFTSPVETGWFLKSVNIAGRNAADEPAVFGRPNDWRGQVTAVFSSAGGEIVGRAVNSRKEPVASYAVVAFAVNRARWYAGSRFIRVAAPDDDGRFTVGVLPPGDYWVAAVDRVPAGSLEDPELLRRLSTLSQRVSLAAGERMDTDLPLVSGPR